VKSLIDSLMVFRNPIVRITIIVLMSVESTAYASLEYKAIPILLFGFMMKFLTMLGVKEVKSQ